MTERERWALTEIVRCGNAQGDAMLDLAHWALNEPMPDWARERIEERYRAFVEIAWQEVST